jgi:hypothetical protein
VVLGHWRRYKPDREVVVWLLFRERPADKPLNRRRARSDPSGSDRLGDPGDHLVEHLVQ